MNEPVTDLSDRGATTLSLWAGAVLVPVAVIGAVLSFRSLYEAAVPTFGPVLAAGFPLLVDLLILGASLQFVAGAKIGRPRAGWRLTAHAGVLGTLVLNALAAKHWRDVPWHITAPAVWAVLVELTARQVLGEWGAVHRRPLDRISALLWISSPVKSTRIRLHMLRIGSSDAQQVRREIATYTAARVALRLAMPGGEGRGARRLILRQVRDGSVPPQSVLSALGWGDEANRHDSTSPRPSAVLRAVLEDVLGSGDAETPGAVKAENLARRDPGSVSHDVPDKKKADAVIVHDAATCVDRLEGSQGELEHSGASCLSLVDSDLSAASARQEAQEPRRGKVVGPGGLPQRLATAVTIVRNSPNITGPQLRAELSRRGWRLSDRTAQRILTHARRAVVHATSDARVQDQLAAVNGR